MRNPKLDDEEKAGPVRFFYGIVLALIGIPLMLLTDGFMAMLGGVLTVVGAAIIGFVLTKGYF